MLFRLKLRGSAAKVKPMRPHASKHKQRGPITMKTSFSTRPDRAIFCFALVTACTALTPSVQAQCSSMTPRLMVAGVSQPAAIPSFAQISPDSSAAQAHGADPDIVGLWNVTFTSGGQVVDQAFETFHSDGTEMMVDTAAPSSGNVCSGVWAKTGSVTIKLNHPSWTFDNSGNLNGTASIKVTVTLDPNSDSFTGTFTVDVFTLGGVNTFHLAGTVAGKRIQVD
jgi:hypothetical protein